MKTRYIILISILILLFITFIISIIFTCIGTDTNFESIIQVAGIFTALLASIIALSASDPIKRKVKVTIEPFVDKTHTSSYPHDKLTDELKEKYNSFPDPIKSYHVQFKLTNNSGFTLNNPTLTFRLPLSKQHPEKKIGHKSHKVDKYERRNFNSNIFNVQKELSVLEFADTRLISNSALPYWNDKFEYIIWIRMVLDDGEMIPFDIEVSINCENAEGVTQKIELDPNKLL